MPWQNNPEPQQNFPGVTGDVITGAPGTYTRPYFVDVNTDFWATGSNVGAAAIVVVNQDVLIYGSKAGTITGSALDAGVVHPIGVKRVVTGAAGQVYLLYAER